MMPPTEPSSPSPLSDSVRRAIVPLCAELDRALESLGPRASPETLGAMAPVDHAEFLTGVTTLCSAAFHAAGLDAVLVGGGAIEFYVPGAYITGDIDLVVGDPQQPHAPPRRAMVDAVFRALGFVPGGARHWVRGPLLVEVPDHDVAGPVLRTTVGSYTLAVIAPEAILVGRLVEYEQTGNTGHAMQAIDLLRAMGDELDPAVLRQLVRAERVDWAYQTLRQVATDPAWTQVSEADLTAFRDTWRGTFAPVHEDVETLVPRATSLPRLPHPPRAEPTEPPPGPGPTTAEPGPPTPPPRRPPLGEQP